MEGLLSTGPTSSSFFANQTFSLIESTLRQSMERFETACVRNEYNLWMFKEYLLPSNHFLLTVHTLTPIKLSKLETVANIYVKKWAGLPQSATNAVIHLKGGLELRSISELYTGTHATSHARNG